MQLLKARSSRSGQVADVSVIVPLYNHETYVEQALASVYAQTVRPREVIVVDDGSTDRSLQIVRDKFGHEDNLILWSKPNAGAHHTINAGIHRATSSHIAILNSDDVYEPARLETCLQALSQDPEADMVCTGLSFIDGAGAPITSAWYDNALAYFRASADLELALVNANFLTSTSNFVIRRQTFEKYGYFVNLRYTHDLAFLLQLLRQQGKLQVLDAPLLKYRFHATNTIAEDGARRKLEWAAVLAEHLLRVHPDKQADASPQYWASLYEILDRHNLARLLPPLVAAVAAGQGGAEAVLADRRFFAALLPCVR